MSRAIAGTVAVFALALAYSLAIRYALEHVGGHYVW